MMCLNISNIAIITFKEVDYRCIMYNISKSKAINLLENYMLEDREYIKKNLALIFYLVYIKWLMLWTSTSL